MTRETNRPDRATTEDEALAMLEQTTHGVLALVDEDGAPYGVPLNHVLVGRTLYFHGSPKPGHKLAAATANPQACYTVVERADLIPGKYSTDFASAMAFGALRIVPAEDAEHTQALLALCERCSPLSREKSEAYVAAAGARTAVFALDITRATGKRRSQN